MAIVQVSCKITSSLLHYLERHGVSIAPVTELYDGPEEFLKDPHFWIDVEQAERFFERAAGLMNDPQIGRTVGTQAPDLNTWGALDSVFKLMSSPKDYYASLSRLLSYFVTPVDGFFEIERGHSFVRFIIPIMRDSAPQVFEFIRSAFENLPRYTGYPSIHTDYSEVTKEIFLSWDTAQPSLFSENPGYLVNPKLIQNLTNLLELNQRALDVKNRQLVEKQTELDKLRTELRQQVREKVYAEKMTSLAQLAAGVAHEINNPLSYIMSNLRRFEEYSGHLSKYINDLEGHLMNVAEPKILQDVAGQKEKQDINYILTELPVMFKEATEGLTRVKEIVKDLSSLAHPDEARTESKMPADVSEIIESSLKVFSDRLQDKIKIKKSFYLLHQVPLYPVRMGQVFMNLISNALDAMPGGGVLEIRTSEKNGAACIEFIDTGLGMNDETLSKLFTPFFTTKEAGKGSGLGLSIAQSLVELHRGRIQVESAPGRGSQFTVTLPL